MQKIKHMGNAFFVAAIAGFSAVLADEGDVTWWNVNFAETESLADADAFKKVDGKVLANYGGQFTLGTGDRSKIDGGKLVLETDTDKDSVDKRLKWTPVDPASRLANNAVEFESSLDETETLPDISNDGYQFALVCFEGTFWGWNGSEWKNTNVAPVDGDEKYRFLFDYSDMASPKVSVYAFDAGEDKYVARIFNFALAKPANGIKAVHFAGSGEIDDFKATLSGDPATLAVAPGDDFGSYDSEDTAKALAEFAEVKIPEAVKDKISNENGYTALFKIEAARSGDKWTLNAVLNDDGKNAVKTGMETVAAQVEAKISQVASSGTEQKIEIAGLTPGLYYAVASSGDIVGEYQVADGGWAVADGSDGNNGKITVAVPAPGEGGTSAFYVIKVKTVQ